MIRRSLEESLKELGTDTVDIFYLHAADRNVRSPRIDKLFYNRTKWSTGPLREDPRRSGQDVPREEVRQAGSL